ncbi:retrovirus-related pol polyprotein from transposon TNT 1-94 [Tanacetum coccineum]
MTWHPIVTIPLLPDFGGVTDWYQEPRIMPPRRLKKKYVKRLVEKRVAKAIEEYEKSKANLDSAGSSRGNTGNITSSKPATLHDAINMARELVEQAVQGRATRIGESNKRKWEDHQRNTNNNNPNNNNNNNNRNRNNNYHQQQNRRHETARAYAAAPAEGRGYAGNLPKCNRCNSHHNRQCPPNCQKCQRTGHREKDCRVRVPGAGVTLQDVTCYGCGEKGHFKDKCPKGRNQQNKGARARAYVVAENPQQNPNVVTGTFLLNDHYACILFDSGAEKSFVSFAFTPFIDIAPTTLNTSYEVELADGKVENVKMILEGSELTKDDRESQLYNKFEHFRQIKGETIQGYYVRFITEVKLNRGLKESNFDQLYAYLKQHEYPTQSSKSPQSSNEPSPADNFQLDSGSSSTENLIESLSNSLALLTQSYKSHLPQTNNQLRTSSNARNKATVQDGRVVVQDVRGRYNANNQGKPFQRNNARGNVVAGNVGGQNRGGIINPGPAKPIKCYNCNGLGHIARECPRPKRLQDSDYFKDKMLLMQAQENGAVLDEEQSLFLAGEQIINFDEDVDNSPENDLALNVDHVFEADECDAFDSDVDEGPTTQTMFMTNLTSEDQIYDEAGPSYDSNTPFEYVEDNEDHVVQSNVSSVRNDALMSILDEMHEQGVQSRLANKPDMIVNDSVSS